MSDHRIPKVVYGMGGKRVNSLIELERMLDDSAVISTLFKDTVMAHAKEVMKEAYLIGKEAGEKLNKKD